MPLLTYFFLGWVGLGVGEFVGFMMLVVFLVQSMFSNPAYFATSQTP